MNSNRRLTQKFRSQTSHSSRPSSASAAASNHHFADRLAINLSGNLGCPYDVRRDSVLPTILRSHHAVQSCKLHKAVDCFIIKGDTFDTEQLFRRIGISDEIWLNVSLEIVSEEEIGSLVNYSFPNTGNTRYFYYYYSDQQKNLPNDPNMVMKDISHDIPDITATHIISSIKLGIYVFVALELPSGDHQILDQLLDRIGKEMVDKKLHLSNEEIVLLNKITISKVFSNITDLKKVEDLYSICRKTIEMKQRPYEYRPLYYTLRPINWFYLSYPRGKAKYIPLEPETIKFIKQHVLLLSKVKRTLEAQLEKQNNIIQKHIANIEEMYSDTIKQISQLILNIRCGKMEQQSIVVTLQEKTNDTMKQIHFLIEKLQLIQELKNENIEYLNMEKYDISALDDLKTILLKVLEKNNSYLVFCSTDEFKQNYPSAWHKSYKSWINERESNTSRIFFYADFSYSSCPLSEVKVMLLETENHTIKHHSPLTTRTRQLSDTKSQDYGETINLPPVRVEKDKSLSESSEIVKTTDSSLLENQEIKEDSESLNTLSASMQTIVETTTSQLEKSEQSANSTDELNTIVLHTQKPEPRPRKSKQSVAKNLISNESESLIQSMHENAIVSNEEFKGMENYSTNASISTDKFLTTREQKHIAESLQVTPASTLESSRHERKYSRPTTVPSTAANLNSAAREQRRQRASHTQDIKYVNILLLGTSGVGKSTFINALVNYHAFETLQEARSNSPHVVMPVSFPLSVGDQFEEHMVTFGDDDANEDHHHPGQSVTQHCRSYLFPIDSRTKLRIIDTPGMNDTRGIDQDDLNMQHILSFINNLSHLNAICILLKPNKSRLNIILRSYFTHLFSFIGENVYKNVVFCFTHTRSTFFAPGNTAPLLREMINKLPMNGVRFLKSNTFCFDSESFRYLIALNNGIEFDAFEREEYEKSWLPSTTESKRFIQYICEDLEPIMEEKWQSIEHVQFKINEIIRPLLETVRNCIRNIILFQEESYDMFIKLSSFAVQYSSAICYQCERTPKQFNGVLILPDDIHILTDKCNDCGCSKNKHGEIKYTLDYQSIQKPPKEFVNELQKTIKQLTESLLEFAQIYASTNENVQNNDPVVSALKRMINEESQLCSYEENQNDINSKLHQVLNDLLEKYKNKRSVYKSNKISIDLSSIYSHIRESSAMKEVAEQLGAIKQAQDIYMKEHEKQVL